MANLKNITVDEGISTWPNGNTLTIDLLTGGFFEIDLNNAASSGIQTFNISNTHADQISEFTLKLKQASPARQFIWSGLTQFKWAVSPAPSLSGGLNMIDILQFTTYNAGSVWYGKVVGQNFG